MLNSDLYELVEKVNKIKEINMRIKADIDVKTKERDAIINSIKELGIDDIKNIKTYMDNLKVDIDKDMAQMDELIDKYEKGKK